MSQIEEQVEQFILDNFLFGDSTRMPARSDSLVETGVIDSTGVLELIEFLESRFSLTVDEEETVPANLDSIDALSTFIRRKAA